jgi:glycosyltransferase involved in cell wall biosynthesis
MKIIVGIPAYNEEKNIGAILVKLQKLGYSVMVCDDGSSDMTKEISEKMGAIVIHHKKNLGYGASIRSLFLKAKETDYDVLVTFDGDGQHDVSEIEKIIKPIEGKKVDIVIGNRFLEGKSKVPKYRKVGIKAINKVTNATSNQKISDTQSGFRAYGEKALKEIIPSENGMGVSTEILIKANQKKLNIIEIPITITYGEETSTHNPLSHGVSVILSTMKFVSIERPLRFYGLPGIGFLMIGLFFVVWTIQGFTDTRQVTTNVALIGIGSTIFGMMLLMTSIMLFSIVNIVREKRE